MLFNINELPYEYDALEPYIDAQTMELHREKHHIAYATKLNNALESVDLKVENVEKLLSDLNAIPSPIRTAVRNNGGGFVNHNLFWEIMGSNHGGEPTGDLALAINKSFGNFYSFKEQFSSAAAYQFGSGWAWLSVTDGKLSVTSTANQDSPISEGATPILGLDVWEHAYYLKYQNRRPEYIEAWWNVINWKAVADRYDAVK